MPCCRNTLNALGPPATQLSIETAFCLTHAQACITSWSTCRSCGWMVGNPSKVDAKRGDYFLQRDLEPPEAIPRATRETIWGDRGEDAPSLARLRRVLGKMSLRQRELLNIQFSLFMPQIEQPVRKTLLLARSLYAKCRLCCTADTF